MRFKLFTLREDDAEEVAGVVPGGGALRWVAVDVDVADDVVCVRSVRGILA